MSLTALALRLATIRALKGRTFAEDRVFDSKINPVNLVVKDEKKPVIVVTTDDNDTTITGRDIRHGDHRLELVIEVAVTTKISVTVEDGGTADILTIPASDAGLETTIGLIGWQISKALSADGGAWGDLWRTLVVKVHSITSRRGADDENGVRYAARQFVFLIDHVADPTPGEELDDGDAWHRALSMMKADNELSDIAKIIQSEIGQGDYMPWEIARGKLGLSNDEAVVMTTMDGFAVDPQE